MFFLMYLWLVVDVLVFDVLVVDVLVVDVLVVDVFVVYFLVVDVIVADIVSVMNAEGKIKPRNQTMNKKKGNAKIS